MINDTADASNVMRFAEANPFYAKAVRTTEHLQVVALRAEALARRDQLRALPTPPIPANSAGLDAYLEASAEAAEHQRCIDQDYQALSTVIAAADTEIAGATNHFPDRILASLAGDLSQLMAKATTVVSALDGATTADEAITAGTVKAWAKLPALRAEYDQIRAAQQHVLGHRWHGSQSHYLDDPFANLLVIRNLDDVFPHWLDEDRSFVTLQATPPDPRPWPNDPIRQLVWLVTSPAEPWLPTPKQFDQLQAERRARLNNIEQTSWEELQKRSRPKPTAMVR